MRKFKMFVISTVFIFTLIGGSFLFFDNTTEIALDATDPGNPQSIQFV